MWMGFGCLWVTFCKNNDTSPNHLQEQRSQLSSEMEALFGVVGTRGVRYIRTDDRASLLLHRAATLKIPKVWKRLNNSLPPLSPCAHFSFRSPVNMGAVAQMNEEAGLLSCDWASCGPAPKRGGKQDFVPCVSLAISDLSPEGNT